MSISIKLDKKFQNTGELYIQKRVNLFYKAVSVELPPLLLATIRKGISPVQGVGRFAQYSKSYVDQIEGKVRFVTVKGHVVPMYPTNKVNAAKGKKGEHSPITHKKNSRGNLGVETKFEKGFGIGKLRSPVTLQMSGAMLGSIQATPTPRGTYIEFLSKLAAIHNNIGVGKNKTKRPFLPNQPGQTFSSLIMKKLKELLNNSFKT